MIREADLYAPVKDMLEAKGYTVKAEVNRNDVVATKGGDPLVIVELKLVFSMDLVLQGIDRQSITDDVYLAIQAPPTPAKRKNWRVRQKGYLKLCRLLGLGLILVELDNEKKATTKVLLDPVVYTPRKNKRRQTRLLAEFVSRKGDPNVGGVNKTKIMTSYRQDALRCAAAMSTGQDHKLAAIRENSGVSRAASILQKNHYGWFERIGRGQYCLTPSGHEALKSNEEFIGSTLQS